MEAETHISGAWEIQLNESYISTPGDNNEWVDTVVVQNKGKVSRAQALQS